MKSQLPVLLIITYCSFLIPHSSFSQTSSDYPYHPVKFSDVTISDSFWSPRIETNRTVTIPFAFSKCEATGRIRNFEVAGEVNTGKISTGKFCSAYGYDDSDVFKVIEGASYSLTTHYDPVLDSYLDSLITKIAAAQENDGYLYSMRTINPEKSWAKERWVNDRTKSSHELYNAGHMYEAAVAHFYATKKRTLLNVAIKNANLMCNTFGPQKMHSVPGHQEIEIGLAKLYRATANKKYLDLAKFFLDERGKGDDKGGEYNQDFKPVTEQDEAVGHAVRAGYMYTAMADIAALTGDPSYIRAIDRIWENVVNRKIYITGGIGADGAWEAFGKNYELPNESAYNETCAAIANVFWNFRMFLLHGESKYIDVLERTLYNGLISGVSLDGKTFFYPNPLQSTGDYSRSEWFDCSCCPSNITRFVSSVSGYIYATKQDTLFVNLFIGGKGKIKINNQPVDVSIRTRYPWEGKIKIRLDPAVASVFTVKIRIPGWAMDHPVPVDLYFFSDRNDERPVLRVNNKPTGIVLSNGYAVISGTWKKGDLIELDLPMPVRKVVANANVTEDRHKVCLTRGPIVFCAEGIDNGDVVDPVIVPGNTLFTNVFNPGLLNGIETLKGNILKTEGDGYDNMIVKTSDSLFLIPYYAWCHRGTGPMNVWFYDEEMVFPPQPDPGSSLFLSSLEVKLKQYKDQETRYRLSTQIQPPDLPYTQPLLIKESCELEAYAGGMTGTVSETVKEKYTKVLPGKFTPLANPRQGLEYSYYTGRIKKLADFSLLQPQKTGQTLKPDPSGIRDTVAFYSIVFRGYIRIPAEGVYTFYSGSDDGSRLFIDDRMVVDNDGVHGDQERSGQAALQEGYHKFELQYFQYNGDEKLGLYISFAKMKKMILPASWYFYNGK